MTCFIFKNNHGFIEESNPLENVAIAEEKLDDIDIDDLGKLNDSPRLALVNEECGNLKEPMMVKNLLEY